MIKHLLVLGLLVSCTNDGPSEGLILREDILELARKGDPELMVMMPPSLDRPLVDCKSYDPPCWGGYKILVKGMEVIALEYMDPKDAVKMARKLDAYRKGNWVFDDVVGEPVLERLIETHVQAVRASKAATETTKPE